MYRTIDSESCIGTHVGHVCIHTGYMLEWKIERVYGCVVYYHSIVSVDYICRMSWDEYTLFGHTALYAYVHKENLAFLPFCIFYCPGPRAVIYN